MKAALPWILVGVVAAVVACGDSSSDPDSSTPVDAVVQDVAYEGQAGEVDETLGEAGELSGDAEIPCVPTTTTTGYKDSCDGTIADMNRSLLWQKGTGYESYTNALAACQSLNLAGLTGWRLPTVDELRGLIRGCDAKTGPAGSCGVHETCWDQTNTKCYVDMGDCMWGCGGGQGPALQGCYLDDIFPDGCQPYWSSTQAKMSGLSEKKAWSVSFNDASVNNGAQSQYNFARCVHNP